MKITISFVLSIILFSTFVWTQELHATEIEATRIRSEIGGLHVPFIKNDGQLDKDVGFYAQTFAGTVFVTKNGEIVYGLPNLTLKEQFIDGTIKVVTGERETISKISSFQGKDPSKWRSNISSYSLVNLGEVYQGINVKLKAYGNNIEKLFIVNPTAQPEQIKLKLSGGDALNVNSSGELEIETASGVVAFTKPIAYQEEAGQRKYIEVAYTVDGMEYGFAIGNYDRTKELIIDPLLASTFIGGSNTDDDYEPSIIVDESGNVYLSGYTYSANFPTTSGAYSENYNGGGSDRFVSKLDSDLTTIIASTFIGGSGNEFGMAICLDDDGYLYLGGYTTSSNFPTTTNAYDTSHNGARDAFLAKFDSDLTTLLGSTFLGGSGDEGFNWPRIDLVTGENGNVYVVGITKSGNFPCTDGAYDTTYNGGSGFGGDAFVSKFDTDLTNLLASTYIGGSDDEWRVSIDLDEDENIFITGDTSTASGGLPFQPFPTTENAYDPTFNAAFPGHYDIFVSKFTNDLTTLSASTFLGTRFAEDAIALRVDEEGNVYVAGFTISSDYNSITTPGAYDRSYNGGDRDAIIAKFSNDLTTLLNSTLLGGNGDDTGDDMVLDDNGDIYLVGLTASTNFPCSATAYDATYNGGRDAFVAKLDNNLATLFASTYLGGSSNDRGQAIALNANRDVYIGGRTSSLDFPTTSGAYNENYNGGGNDCFVTKLDNLLSLDPFISNFEASQTSGHSPLEVHFTDLSIANLPILYWAWDFDNDGEVDSDQQNPIWTYAISDTYTVSLQVSNDSLSHTLIKENYIKVFNGESALQFDGENSRVICSASASLNLTESLTIEAWINPADWGEGANGSGRVVDKDRIQLYLVEGGGNFNDHSLVLQCYHASAPLSILCTPDNSILLNEWQHIAVTYNGSGNVKMFINGIEQTLDQILPASGNISDNSNYDLIIGNNYSRSYTFDGVIDEVRLWNIVRSGQEIEDNRNRYLSGAEEGLVGYWQMNEAYGETIIDLSDYSNDGMAVETVWVGGALDPSTPVKEIVSQVTTPQKFVLHSNYPNPFNLKTTIRFDIPFVETDCVERDCNLSLRIYDASGKLVRTLINEKKEAGYHSVEWNGLNDSGRAMSSGVYFYKIETDQFSEAKRMILLK